MLTPAYVRQLAVAGALVAAPAAFGDSIDMTYRGRGAGQVVQVQFQDQSARVFAGELTYDFANGQGAARGHAGAHTVYRRAMPDGPLRSMVGRRPAPERGEMGYESMAFSEAQRRAISGVLKRAAGAEDADAAAAQIAIWELAHDFEDRDLHGGTFTAMVDDDMAARVNRLMTATEESAVGPARHISFGGPAAPEVILTTDGMVVAPLPAPAALAAVGLLGALVASRRRKAG